MKACAYVVGPSGGSGAALRDMARKVGFEAVHAYSTVEAAEQQAQTTPLIYFLFAAAKNLAAVKRVAEDVRSSGNPQVRFSPMIYFAETPSLDAIRTCINIGFDDVITLPFTMSRVVERLTRQLEQKLVYFQTDTYFGPDRRGRLEDEAEPSRRGEGGQYRRMEIVRSPLSGISVLSDEMQVVL
jgi:hypothetical protein